MKKDFLLKGFVIIATLFVVLQSLPTFLNIKESTLSILVNIKYVVMAILILWALLYSRSESKKLFNWLLVMYVILIVLVILFKIRGII